jgi:hypothetical protein
MPIPDPARTEPMADACVKLLRELGATNEEAASVFLTLATNHLIATEGSLARVPEYIRLYTLYRQTVPIPASCLVKPP